MLLSLGSLLGPLRTHLKISKVEFLGTIPSLVLGAQITPPPLLIWIFRFLALAGALTLPGKPNLYLTLYLE